MRLEARLKLKQKRLLGVYPYIYIRVIVGHLELPIIVLPKTTKVFHYSRGKHGDC